MRIALLAKGVVLGLALSVSTAFAQPNNLLENSDLNQGENQTVPGWVFSTWNFRNDPAVGELIKWEVASDADRTRCLSISTKNEVKTLVWSQQLLAGKEGVAYELSVKAKGGLEWGAYGALDLGIYFLDADGQWIGYEPVKTDFKHSDQWQKVSGKITAPARAAKMGVRMGMGFSGMVKVFFKEPVLIEVAR